MHSPCLAHDAHDSSRSEHISEHTPQLCGQMVLTCSLLSPSHSPSRAHALQELSLSLQKPSVAEVPERPQRMSKKEAAESIVRLRGEPLQLAPRVPYSTRRVTRTAFWLLS